MDLKLLSGEQKKIHDLIIELMRILGCVLEVQEPNQAYKIRCGEGNNGPICLYIEFKGGSTTTYPAYSIHAFAAQSTCLEDDRFLKKNNVYGPSFDVVARPEIPVEVTLLFEFICRAIWCCKMQKT